MRNTIGLWTCALAVIITMGCDAAEVFNCSDICETYDDCVVEDVDVTDCIDRCEDLADLGEESENRIEACQDCYNDLACTSECNDTCAGVVPAL